MKRGQFKVISLEKSFYMKPDEYLNGWAKKCGWKATLVYDSLWRHADRNREAFPSVKLMAEEHGVSRDSIMKGIRTLEEYNIISKQSERSTKGKFLHNTYFLLEKNHWKDPSRSQQHGSSKSFSATHQVAHSDYKGTHITKHITLSRQKQSLKGIKEEKLQEISENYQVPLSFVRSKYDDLINYCERTGKKYKNYEAALKDFVKKDAMKLRQNQLSKSLII